MPSEQLNGNIQQDNKEQQQTQAVGEGGGGESGAEWEELRQFAMPRCLIFRAPSQTSHLVA